MSETNHFSERLREPLNETTRKVRRNLMASAVIGVVITKVGLVPSKISDFGIEFTSSNQQALMLLLASAIAYFAISFLDYVYSELTAWHLANRLYIKTNRGNEGGVREGGKNRVSRVKGQ